jgi:peptide chain release factor subunit 1
MQQFSFLDKVLNYEPDGGQIISVYLNTEPNENGQKVFDVFLRKQIDEHGAVIQADTPERRAYDASADKINTFTSKIDPSTRGVAIFTSVGSDDFFHAFEFAVPFEDDIFEMSDRPHVYGIVRLIEQNPPFAVVAADTNKAHIYVFKRGHTVDVQSIQNVVTNRSEVGGWSQMRFQRHVDNFHQQHAKEVVAELEKIVRDENLDHVVLLGDETIIIPMLKQELSKELSEKISATLPMNVDTPEHEVLDAASAAIRERDAELDKEKIAALMEQNYDRGRGVTGVETTLTALLNGQVQELYISSDTRLINYDRNNVRQILREYQPGEDTELPDPRERAMIIDELLRRAAMSADKIRFIENTDLLVPADGVGALLRYQAKGVTNL